MRPALAAPILVAALALAAAKDDPLAGRVAGAPIQCIDPGLADGPQITDAGQIIYRRTEKRLLVSTPIDGCRALRPQAALIVQRFGSQLCRGDRFQVLDAPSRIPSASCRFGAFVPWDKP